VLTDRGNPAEAEPLLREALAVRSRQFGADDRRTARAERTLALCLAAQGQRAEAERLLLHSYQTLSGATNWFHRTLGNRVLQDLVRLYRGWGEPAKAARFEGLLRSRS
jgi:Flp pilus assembly protein TadD